MKKKIIPFFLLAIASFVGCSKDDNVEVDSKAALKVTVTVSSAYSKADGSYVEVSAASADAQAKSMKWTVNGESGTEGQVMYSVAPEYFNGGKTAVLESGSNYLTSRINVAAFSTNVPFTVSYKIEQGGKVLVNKTKEILKDASPLTEVFNY